MECHFTECDDECRFLCILMLNVVVLSVVIISIDMLSVVMPSLSLLRFGITSLKSFIVQASENVKHLSQKEVEFLKSFKSPLFSGSCKSSVLVMEEIFRRKNFLQKNSIIVEFLSWVLHLLLQC
jgi:hypothetical protein